MACSTSDGKEYISSHQGLLTSSVYHAGDYDSILSGSYGDNIAASESSRELIVLLQKLIRVIGENGPLKAFESTPLLGTSSIGVMDGSRLMPIGEERRAVSSYVGSGKQFV